MKKRILALVVAVLMLVSVFAMASCKAEPTNYELVSDALTNVKALDEADMEINIGMKMSVMGMTMEMPVKMSMQAKGLTTDDPVAYIAMTMSTMGMSVDMEMYTEDGYVYAKVMGETMKQKVEEADMGYADSEMYKGILQDIPEDILNTSAAVVENNDGSKTFTIEFDAETFSELYADLIKDMSESNAEGATIKSCTVDNCKVEITVSKDGYIKVYDIAFDMEMTISEAGMDMAMGMQLDMSCEFKNPGKPVTVKTIEGYKDFPEAPAE